MNDLVPHRKKRRATTARELVDALTDDEPGVAGVVDLLQGGNHAWAQKPKGERVCAPLAMVLVVGGSLFLFGRGDLLLAGLDDGVE